MFSAHPKEPTTVIDAPAPGAVRWSAEPPLPPPVAADEYRETLASLRHFSHLRFAALTLFAGATAGLMSCSFGDTLKAASPTLRGLFPIFGLSVTIVFMGIEFSMRRYIRILFQEAARYRKSHYGLLARHARLPRVVLRNAYIVLYALLSAFWGAVIFLQPSQ